jgi:simple sugar transport system ATP-binding protein
MRGHDLVMMRGIVKTFGKVVAADGIDFDLRHGEIHALLGENGAGKSTLMNVLYGLERPDTGVIEVDGEPVAFRSAHDAIDLGIGMVHQHFKLVPRLTVAENVILGGTDGRRILLPDLDVVGRQIEELGERYGLPMSGDALVGDLSVGEQQRVEVLRALHRGARILILDEPTATLTPVEVDQLLDKLRLLVDGGVSIIIIPHHLDEVMTAADRITVLRNGKDVATISAEETSPLELARLMVGREIKALTVLTDAEEVRAADDHGEIRGPATLALEGLASAATTGAAAEGSRAARAFADLNLEVHAGEIVTIAGVEGNGQAELEETLLGLTKPERGRILFEGTDVTAKTPAELFAAGIGFIHSDRYRRGLISDLPVAHNMVYDRIDRPPYGGRFSLYPKAILAKGAELVKQFTIAVRSPGEAAATLSGGNAQRVVLARALSQDLKLLVAAQPTRGLDVGAIEFVWDHLQAQRAEGLGILLITTDLDEVLALSDRCYVIYRGRLTVDREQIGLAMGGARVAAAGGGEGA